MRYVVAGAVLLIAFIIGIVSFLVTMCFDMVTDEGETIEAKDKEAPVTTLTALIRKIGIKEYVIIAFMSLLCGVVSYQIYAVDMDVVSKIRLVIVGLLLLSVMVIDWKTHRIPNVLSLLLLGIGVVYLAISYFVYPATFGSTITTSVVGLIGCLFLFYLLARLTKEGIGMGDVKMIAALGFVFGLGTTIMIVMIALFICALVAIFLMMGRKKTKNETIAFGPFLFFGYIVVLLLITM